MKRMKMKNDEKVTLEKGWEKFVRHNQIKDLSDYTLNYYRRSYYYFTDFLESEIGIEHGREFEASEVTEELFEDFVMWLRETYDMNNTSVNTRIRGVRAFIYYMMEKGYVDEFNIVELKVDQKLKNTYTDSELEKLLEKPNLNECSFAQYRNWVIVNFLLATGVRSRTVRNIKIRDINLQNATVDLRKVKNRKQQIIPLSQSLIKILEEYLGYRNGESEEYLFCNTYQKKLKSSSLNSAIRVYNHSRGVEKTSPHLFRHTFAKKWILAGGDIFRLQKILGHSSMSVVREYVNMFGKDLKQNFNQFNPLEQLNKTNGEHIKMS